MSNNMQRKGASDSDLMILVPLALIITALGILASSLAH